MENQPLAALPLQPESVASEYTAEVRFGVVMYGGVSLAIYINGVANELFEMACSTPRSGVVLDRRREASTREVYRRLSWLAGNRDLRARYAEQIAKAKAEAGSEAADTWARLDKSDCTQTRFVVDVISGTSAGGINGVFLAKALANGQQFGALKELWVNEGDIGLLLNDERSYSSMEPKLADRSAEPTSLLNSDRMYAKLLYAMGTMEPLDVRAWPSARHGSPLVEEVDLFVTTTDIEGTAVPLRLFDKVVYERRHKQNYHFSYPNGVTPPSGNDFTEDNNAFLAFAARCTSSFPFAFEPMTLSAVTRLKADGRSDGAKPEGVKRWKAFFPNLPREEVQADAHEHRAFGDGGYLDNKPFTYVVDTLSQRFSSVPLERKLVFVEPSPEQLDPHRLPDPEDPPDALENSLAALTSIPRYETIREDLQSVLQRNRRIERVERMVRLGEIDIEKRSEPFARVRRDGGMIPIWSSLKLSEMVDYYGLAFLPYQRLRVYSVTDDLADRLGARWGIDRGSDHQYALRALVRVWREQSFHDEGDDGRATINAFLDQFDLDYRLRRLGFLLRKIDQLVRLFRKRCAGPLDTAPRRDGKPTELSDAELQMVGRLPEPYTELRPGLELQQLRSGLRVLGLLKTAMIDVRASLLAARRAAETPAPGDAALDPALRNDLKSILLLVLGQVRADQTVQVSGPGAAARVDVALDPDALRLASASRTLQEGVAFRAQALFAAAAKVRTPLYAGLEADLETMRVKSGGRGAPTVEPLLNRLSGRVWALLGKPRLASEHGDDDRIVVEIGDASEIARDGGVDAAGLADLNTEVGHALRRFLSDYYLRFDSFDQMGFPLYYDTDTGEPSTVEVIRVSPVDATNLIAESTDRRRKLAGTALANFGAFLDRRWRLNDIMWGRLDGAERLIQALLPMSDSATVAVRAELIELAHRGILREALVPDGSGDLTALVVDALAEVPEGGDTAQRLKTVLAQLWTGDRVARDRLEGVIASLLSERGLMEYVRRTREVDPDPEPKATLESATRAVTIAGRVLEGISSRHGRGSTVPRWLARLGLMLQGVVAVSLPGTLKHRFWTHGLKVLYSFEVVALIAAVLFGSSDMRALAVTALGVTAGVHLLTLIAGDVMRERRRWLRVAVSVVLLGLIGLAVLGALTLVRHVLK